MITRRSLLKQGIVATLSGAAALRLGRIEAAQSTATSFDFYISPAGLDSNPGTIDRPWAITAINAHRDVYAGKRVGLLDGVYNVYSLCESSNGYNRALDVNGGPSPESPTVIAAVNARQAVITGADPSTGAYPSKDGGIIGQGFMTVANKGNVILDGLTVTHGFGVGIGFYPLQPPYPEGGATGIVVRNCEVFDILGNENNNPGGIKLRCCTGALISNNKIHGVKPLPAGRNSAGIFSFNCRSNIYEYNTIYDGYTGIFDKNIHNGNQTYRYNHIELTGPNAVVALRDGSGGDPGDVITVYNNILIAPSTWDGTDLVNPSKQSLVFYNNTCYNTGQQGGGILYLAGGTEVSPPATVTFYNNVMYLVSAVGWGGMLVFPAGTVTQSNYNLYRFQPSPRGMFGVPEVSAPRGKRTLYTLKDWQKLTGLDGSSVESTITSGSLFGAMSSMDPSSYALQQASLGRNLGRVGGTASGAPTDIGAWGGGARRIGCDFGALPRAPLLGVN